MIGIYKITNPLNEIYIGKSVNIIRRFKQHKTSCSNKKLKLSFDIHGIENHKFEVLFECKESDLFIKEQEMINIYKEHFTLLNFDYYVYSVNKKYLVIRDVPTELFEELKNYCINKIKNHEQRNIK